MGYICSSKEGGPVRIALFTVIFDGWRAKNGGIFSETPRIAILILSIRVKNPIQVD